MGKKVFGTTCRHKTKADELYQINPKRYLITVIKNESKVKRGDVCFKSQRKYLFLR